MLTGTEHVIVWNNHTTAPLNYATTLRQVYYIFSCFVLLLPAMLRNALKQKICSRPIVSRTAVCTSLCSHCSSFSQLYISSFTPDGLTLPSCHSLDCLFLPVLHPASQVSLAAFFALCPPASTWFPVFFFTYFFLPSFCLD